MECDRQFGDTCLQKHPAKLSTAWIFWLLFLGCFFAAIFLANIGWKGEASWIGYLSENNLIQGVAGSEQIRGQLMVILRQRLPFWLLFVCFSQTFLGLLCGAGFAAWQGISMGFVFSAMLLRYGLRGMLVFGALCFPHYLIYLVSYVLLYRLMLFYRRQKRQKQLWQRSQMDRQRKAIYVVCCIVLSAVFVLGIALEYYVNPYFLVKIVRIL